MEVGLRCVALESKPTGLERDEIDESDRVLARQESGALARIENQCIAAQLVPMAMGMSVEQQVDFSWKRRRRFFGIVDDQNLAPRPTESARRWSKIHSEPRRLLLESDAFEIVIVAENAEHRNVESRELLKHGRTGDIARMHDAFDTGLAEEGQDLLRYWLSFDGYRRSL